MTTSTRNTLFGRGISMATILLVLLGMWLMWLAFVFVRVITVWLLFHAAEVAFILALIGLMTVLLFWRPGRLDR